MGSFLNKDGVVHFWKKTIARIKKGNEECIAYTDYVVKAIGAGSGYLNEKTYSIITTTGQKTLVIPDNEYQDGKDLLNVYANGAHLTVGTDYIHTGSGIILTESMEAGNEVNFVVGRLLGTGASYVLQKVYAVNISQNGQTVIAIPDAGYKNGIDILEAYVNGMHLSKVVDYAKTETGIILVEGIDLGNEVTFVIQSLLDKGE